MKNKSQFCYIRKTIFPSDILIAVATEKEIIAWIKKNRKYDLDTEEKEALVMDGCGRCVILKCGAIIIRLSKVSTKIGIDVTTLSHEASHAVFFILSRIKTPHTDDTDEVYSYYLQYIIDEALNYFDK